MDKDELEMFCRQCEHDGRFRNWIIQEYLRLREKLPEVEALARKALQESSSTIRLLMNPKFFTVTPVRTGQDDNGKEKAAPTIHSATLEGNNSTD